MPAFDIVVVGSGGGLDETNLSAYLVKPSDKAWDDGIVALEAGSGHGALRQIMHRNPEIFGERSTEGEPLTPSTVYANVKCFLLTHAHLDHISSLVMSAGTLGGCSKRIYGSPQTLKDLESVFSDRVWPKLATYDESNSAFRLFYHALHADGKYKTIFPDVAVRTMTISHGKNAHGPYDSSCFFFRHLPTKREFLFFGDVEPDSVALRPRNVTVWRAAAPKIPHDLSAVFIECSYAAGRRDEVLWGHLTPEHLAQEMVALATEVVLARQSPRVKGKGKGKAGDEGEGEVASASASRPRKRRKKESLPPEALYGALTGLRVYVMHCKEHFDTVRPVSHVIGDQCREMLAPHKLGLELLTADQGMKIVI